MAFSITGQGGLVGFQPISTNSTTQKHRLGIRVRGYDATLLEGEFIYLKGVASTVVGSLVEYSDSDFDTTLTPDTAATGRPVAVAMSACVANEFGWYQVFGLATIKKTAVVVNPGKVKIYQSATTGRVMPTAASSKMIWGCIAANAATVAAATSTVICQISYPQMSGVVV